MGDWFKLHEEGPAVVSDFAGLFVGERLGYGIGRQVFALATDQTKVVKIETGSRSFQNIREWEIWGHAQHCAAKKWLAPCRFISACGIILIMDRTEPVQRHQLPKLMPTWLTDFKPGNFGRLGNRVVAHDYGYAPTIGFSDKVKRVTWNI